MPSPPFDESPEALRLRLTSMMRTIARRDPNEPFEPRDDMRCIGDGLLVDSLDVLEFVVAMDRDFGVSIRDGNMGREALQNVGALTRFVQANRTR